MATIKKINQRLLFLSDKMSYVIKNDKELIAINKSNGRPQGAKQSNHEDPSPKRS